MPRITARSNTLISLLLLCVSTLAASQQPSPIAQLNESGHILFGGHMTPYLIRRLPVSSYPGLPASIQEQLNRRGCLIPQTYEAHRPENVIHASLEDRGASDWAVLCSAQGTVSLLVFFTGNSGQAFTLATAPETERLQTHDSSGVLGFNWGIDPATPEQLREARAGTEHRSPLLDHDALADTLVDHHTIYHFYLKSAWVVLEMQN
jgi:hypothetical protein